MTYAKEKEVAGTTSNKKLVFDKTINNTTNSNTKIPEHIDKKHWDEWTDSGVNYAIISRNVRSLHDPLAVDKLLNRNNKSRWKHSSNLIPCWSVSGVDPETGEPTLLGIQVKPDTPILNKQGKLQKYLGASEYQSAPLFLDTGINDFWQEIINTKVEPIIITEGAKKAGAGLSIGYTTISIPGVSTCRKNGRLHDSLQLFTGFGRTFYLCFDNDIIVKKPVQNAMLAMAKELSATGSKVMVIELPPGELKGMDDFIANYGKDAFHRLVENAKTIEEWRKHLEEEWVKQQLEDGQETKCKLKRQFEIIRDGWGEGLRLNQMKNQIELAGQPLDLDQIRLHMVLEFEEAVPIGDAQAIVQMLANQNAYHPVADYLEHVTHLHPDVDTSILNNLATRYFGSDNELHNIYMKKVLISAVARVMQPGCRVESVPILVNPRQGIGKSTFWRNLFGEDWFSDDMGEANEKDERMKLHNFWCLEWSEFENVYKKKDVSALKKFITTKTDSYRTPYSRTIKEYPRRSILVGTTNEKEILADPTGSRRFWVIPVKNIIPVEQLVRERDLLWAAAYALYQAGEDWKLTSEQEELREELNKQFQVIDPWTEQIQEYIQGRDVVTLTEIFRLLAVETARQDVGTSRRISAIFSRLGWETERKREGGCWVRRWVKKDEKLQNLSGSSGSSGSMGTDKQVQKDTDSGLNLQHNNQSEKNTQSYLDQSATTQQGLQELIQIDPDRFCNFSENSDHLDTDVKSDSQVLEHADPDRFSEKSEHLNSPTSSPKDLPAITPKIEEGKIYWSRSLNKQVKVIKVYASVKKADCHVAGDAIAKPRLAFSDLLLSSPPYAPGDKVKVLEGEHKGLDLVVSSVDADGNLWLKKDSQKFAPPLSNHGQPYTASQLKRT
ncbi:MAG: VapE domain-containing protein [Nodularia sp. CChRGM 3473]